MDQQRYDKGLAIRKEVLGTEYVETALANAGEFAGEFQELLTEYCWGVCGETRPCHEKPEACLTSRCWRPSIVCTNGHCTFAVQLITVSVAMNCVPSSIRSRFTAEFPSLWNATESPKGSGRSLKTAKNLV